MSNESDARDELSEAFELGALSEVEQLIDRAINHVDTARAMPMSASVMINREELLEILEEARARLPEELRAARWLLKEREEFLARTNREGDEIIDQARARAARMVQRSEVVNEAERRARHIMEEADANARTMRLQCEDFCDQRLAQFEIVLERTMKMVAAGREHLAAPSSEPLMQPELESDGESSSSFFDQDSDSDMP